MENLFLILFLVCFIGLIVGVINPKAVVRWGDINKRNRKSVVMYYGIGTIVFFILFGFAVGNVEKNTKEASNNTTASISENKTTSEKAKADKVEADKKIALEFDNKIISLGDTNVLTLDKEGNINSIRIEYEGLTRDQKSFVSKLNTLVLAEQKITNLKDVAKKAQEEKAAAEKAAADKVAYDTGITYNQLARTPDNFKDKKVKFTGEVIQVMEGKGETQLRIAVNGNYDNILLVSYNSKITSTRVLQNDNVTIKGVSQGLYTYEATSGASITIPLVFVDIITIN